MTKLIKPDQQKVREDNRRSELISSAPQYKDAKARLSGQHKTRKFSILHFPFSILLLLLLLCSSKAAATGGDSARLRNEAMLAMQSVDYPHKQIDLLTPGDLNELPLAISSIISNVEYKIAFTNARFLETHAELTAYAKVMIPQGQTLLFGISGLKLSYQGGFIGTARLTLLGDISIPINGGSAAVVLKGGFNIQNGRAQDNLSYVEIDCAGFREAGLAAEVIFPRNMLIPCDAQGDPLPNHTDRVSAAFTTVVHDWNDILAEISLPPFQMNGLDDVVFSVGRATFDFSDLRNSPGTRFPANYRERYLHVPDINLWRGVSVSNLTVMLPKAFNPDNGVARATFAATDLLIDHNGISGNFLARDVIDFEKGNASGWHFSVNEFQIGLEANTLVQAGFSGNIALPIAQKDTMRYTAIIAADNKYLMKVSPGKVMNVDLWMAKMQIDPNSWIKLEVENNRFRPEAMLYGRLDVEAKITPDDPKPVARFDGIVFKALHLQTKEPYLSVDYLGYEGEIGIANFPASIDGIAFSTNGKMTELSFGVKLTLMENAFKGSTRISILGNMGEQDGFQSWHYERCKIGRISIDNARMGGFSLSGEIEFLNNDPVYGDGFGGVIKMNLDCMAAELGLQVRARFGRTDFRYWFVDGIAEFTPGIQASIFEINGLSGGAYYRMSKLKGAMSPTGMPEYKPDKSTKLGVKFGMMFTGVKKNVAPILDGQVEFEMAFGNHGGLTYIGMFGNGMFLGKLPGADKIIEKATGMYNKAQEKTADMLEGLSDAAKLNQIERIEKLRTDKPTDAAKAVETNFRVEDGQFNGIAAYFGISYDFQSKAFQANFDVYVNTAMGLLQGVGQNYRAGSAEIYSEADNWHVYMGTPDNPIGLQFGLGDVRIRTESYFMTGKNIPGSPAPPQEVADILKTELAQLDYMRELNTLDTGAGLAFGSHLKVQTGDLTFLILYANFSAGLGFDMMLKKYDQYCKETREIMGINGWHANAQAYAFLQGELGVKVNLWFVKARFPIIKGAAATLMQAKLPNPAWFRGYLAASCEILGGLVNVNMRFKLEFGTECTPVNPDGSQPPLGMAVISDLTPKATSDVDVFAAPQAAFNFPVGREIPLADDEGNKLYMVEMEYFNITEGGKEIEGKVKWNSRKDAVSFYSKEILPPHTSITAEVKVSFKEKKGSTWQTVYMDGKKSEEIRTITFVTGVAPEEVPLHNIEYAWPVVDQRNFHPGESATGYIQLKQGQDYLFKRGVEQELMIAKSGGDRIFTEFTYHTAQCRIEFTTPAASEYALAVVNKVDRSGGMAAATQVTETQTTEGTFSVANRKAMNFSREDIAKTLLEYPFRSSAYNTFAQKMRAARPVQTIPVPYGSTVISLMQMVTEMEPFDLNELTGTEYTEDKPLVQPLAVMDDHYFRKRIYPILYQHYPVEDIRFERDTAILGAIPVRALPIALHYQVLVEQGKYSSPAVTKQLPYIYDLPMVYRLDYNDLERKVVNRYLGTARQKEFNWIIESYFPLLSNGTYNVRYQFVLPGGKKGSAANVPYVNN